jgi:hypothetical protein
MSAKSAFSEQAARMVSVSSVQDSPPRCLSRASKRFAVQMPIFRPTRCIRGHGAHGDAPRPFVPVTTFMSSSLPVESSVFVMFTIPHTLAALQLPRVVPALALALVALLGFIPRSAAEQGAGEGANRTEVRKPKVPPFSVVEAIVAKELAKKSGYQEGDLITRGDVAAVAPQLENLGFNVRAVSKGIEVLLPDDHPLAAAMRSPQGKSLAPQIKNLELALDRMDRLCHFPAGQDLIRKVFAAPNALAVIEELCLPESVKGLAAKYPDEPACQVLDLPSGRAFTQRQYLEHLRTIHMLAEQGLTRPGE